MTETIPSSSNNYPASPQPVGKRTNSNRHHAASGDLSDYHSAVSGDHRNLLSTQSLGGELHKSTESAGNSAGPQLLRCSQSSLKQDLDGSYQHDLSHEGLTLSEEKMLHGSDVADQGALLEIVSKENINPSMANRNLQDCSLTVLLNKPHLGAYIDPNNKLFGVVTEMAKQTELSVLDWPTYLPMEINYNSHLVIKLYESVTEDIFLTRGGKFLGTVDVPCELFPALSSSDDPDAVLPAQDQIMLPVQLAKNLSQGNAVIQGIESAPRMGITCRVDQAHLVSQNQNATAGHISRDVSAECSILHSKSKLQDELSKNSPTTRKKVESRGSARFVETLLEKVEQETSQNKRS